MTLDQILRDEALRQHEFPVARETVFLGHAGVCPLPRRVAEAIRRYAEAGTQADQEAVLPESNIQRARELIARVLGVSAEEVAFVGPTSLGLNYIASGLPLRKNDNILVYLDDYPSNVYPWTALAEKGVQVRLLNVRELGRIRPIDVEGQIDEDTKLVALGACHFVSGWRIELEPIGKLLRDREIAFCVDGIQVAGAFPAAAAHSDFFAADGHKWLLAPCAAGVLVVRKPWQDLVKPVVYGWHNVRCPNYIAQEEIVFRKDARRYEVGTNNLLGMVGLAAACELLLELGIENIAHELLRKRQWLVPALQAKGCTVLNADAPAENASPIISFFKPNADMAALHAKLSEARIVTSLRADRAGKRYIRLSPHFYNTDAELQRVLDLV